MGERVPSRSILSYIRIHMESASHNALLLTAAVPLTAAGGRAGEAPPAAAAPRTPFDVGRGDGECSSSDACRPLVVAAAEETPATPGGAEGAGSSHGTVDGIVARRRKQRTTLAKHARRREPTKVADDV